jgi:dCMP deaminase
MRLSRDDWAMKIASVTAKRSTCLRRAVGCVLLDADGFILATGYNGVAAGQPHCNEVVEFSSHFLKTYPHACPGHDAPSGTNLEGCGAIHAEQNALLRCRDVREIHTAYVTASPCMHCTKMLLNTGCQRVVFLTAYPASGAQELWTKAGRTWEAYQENADGP